MDVEEGNHEQKPRQKDTGGFSLPAAREVLSRAFNVVEQLGPDTSKNAIVSSLSQFSQQLDRIEALYAAQNTVALEFGLHGALTDAATGAVGNVAGLGTDPNTISTTLPDLFSVAADWTDREHVRALAWMAGSPSEAVRKQLRAYQKAVSDRLNLAIKRAKTEGGHLPLLSTRSTPNLVNPAAAAAPRNATRPSSSPSPGPGPAPQGPRPHSPPQPQHVQHVPPRAVFPDVDERLYCVDEGEEATRKAQLEKLRKLLSAESGGISATPISAVSVFQQQLAACSDWRVRVAALEAMTRSSPEVLWRLLQYSKVLDCLHAWLQDALSDRQTTMVALMLSTMACLPMRRDLLKGSRLEAALEALADGGTGAGPRAGGTNGEGPTARPSADLRRRFGSAAAEVLSEWRSDADRATILRRAGAAPAPPALAAAAAAAPEPVAAAPAAPGPRRKAGPGSFAASAIAAAAPAAPAPVPGSRLLGISSSASAAAKDTASRKRPLPSPRPPGDPRGAAGPRPRLGPAAATATATATAGEGAGEGDGGVAEARVSGQSAANGPGFVTHSVPKADGGSGGAAAAAAAGAGGSGPKRAARSAAAAAAPDAKSAPGAAMDMTAKLGEKGPADPDVVAGFRSRFGDGSVRRSQLLGRPTRAPAAPVGAVVRGSSPGPTGQSGSGPAPGAAGTTAAAAGPAGSVAAGAAAAAAAGPGSARTEMEPGPDDLARLRAERAMQRQAAVLAVLQSEARRHPEVVAAEKELQEAWRRVAARPKPPPEPPSEIRRRLAALRETVPWVAPPPGLLLPPGHLPVGTGEESRERLERGRDRERLPKVSYASPDRVPSTPSEPPLEAQQPFPGGAAAPAVPVPWWPSLEGENGPLEWYTHNLVLWEKGVRRAEHVLPPALLHKHLGLPPEVLPPKYATPVPPPPQHQQHQQQYDAPAAYQAVAATAPPPRPLMTMTTTTTQHNTHLTAPLPVVASWDLAGNESMTQTLAPPATLLSQAPPVAVLHVLPPSQGPPGSVLQLLNLQPGPSLQPHHHQEPAAHGHAPSRFDLPPPPSQPQYEQRLPNQQQQAPPSQPQQPYNYGHTNGHPGHAAGGGRQYPPAAVDDRQQFVYPAVTGDMPPPPPHGTSHPHEAPLRPPAYQQYGPAHGHPHPQPQPHPHPHHLEGHMSYGQGHHRLPNGYPRSPGGDEGGYTSAACGRHYPQHDPQQQQQQQQRRDNQGGWGDRERGGYMHGW